MYVKVLKMLFDCQRLTLFCDFFRYDQGILDVGLTDEDHVELVKTYTYIRKHPTGSAKIELHVLQV